MDQDQGSRRSFSAHRLPVSLSLPRVLGSAPQAAFLAQLLEGSPAGQAVGGRISREAQANERYRLTETSDVRRLPVGYRKSVSV